MEAFFEFSKEVLKGIVRHEYISIPENIFRQRENHPTPSEAG